jgi:hypothetical protein
VGDDRGNAGCRGAVDEDQWCMCRMRSLDMINMNEMRSTAIRSDIISQVGKMALLLRAYL